MYYLYDYLYVKLLAKWHFTVFPAYGCKFHPAFDE